MSIEALGQKSFDALVEETHKNIALIDSLAEGANVLFEFEKSFSLIKYEKHNLETLGCLEFRGNRNIPFISFGSLFNPEWIELAKKRKNVVKTETINVYATHLLDFEWDEEFQMYLVSSLRQDLFLKLLCKLADWTEIRNSPFGVSVGDNIIGDKLRSLVRPCYFESVIVPFIEGKPTRFQVPRWRSWFFNMSKANKRYEKATRNLRHGDFVYVGCKEEVYLLCVTRDVDGRPYMQGTYTTSTKPVLFFSNGYLEGFSRTDAEMPKYSGDPNKPVNVAEYRTKDIPGFNGAPFIFPAIGRSQNCQHSIFTGEPEIITGDLAKALEHFRTTDFSEFSDVVEKYAELANVVHPSNVNLREGCGYKYFF